ncbi:MAG: TonB-dependent receptor, partial [Gammaproteobacteria bacterium]|nr:TonB-dependent receptor [Gammaproteobacteria bacterium]
MKSGWVLSVFRPICLTGLGALLGFSAVVNAAEERVLEEVVTTAQRRAENIQEVPISVSSLEGEKFDNLFDGGEDIRALATRVPSLYAESSNGRLAPRFYIRGLGNQDFDLAASQPVSVIVDDVVLENVILKSFPLFDVERVEVLRGPQGTLFGRNTPAGIVKFDTRKPSQQSEGYFSTSFVPANVPTFSLQGAQGGALSDSMSGRLSVLLQSRKDWIDNSVPAASDPNGLGGKNALGGFSDLAVRAQLLYEPNDRWNVLANLHSRNYEGTSSIFRANVIGPGFNDFNSNYDRDTVTYDEGANNPQSANATGGSIKVNYELNDNTTLTSITAHEVVSNSSLGDIDGGYGADFLPDAGPCPPGNTSACIPFNSQTQDGLKNLDQFTQELRIAQQTSDTTFWQAGYYYFTSEFAVETIPFFIPNRPLVSHENDAWAIFGHVSENVSDTLTLTAGVRYTDDKKDARVFGAPVPQTPVSVSDEEVSWDFSGLFEVNDQVNVFGRISRGFRAPTIQARDVAFFGVPSTAKSETIESVELGFKSVLAGNRVRFNGSVYRYTIEDQQLSAIGGGGNLVQLVNADEGRGIGFDFDAEVLLTDNWRINAGLSTVNTELKDSTLVIPPCGSGLCTVTDPLDANGNAIVNGNSFANAPDYIFTFAADYSRPHGPTGELFFYTDWAFQGETQFLLY